MLRNLLAVAVATCMFAALGQVQAATITVFDGIGAGDLRADWEAATGAFVEEDFSDGMWQGVTTSTTGGGHTGFGITGSLFHDRLAGSSTTIFDFATAITSFGAYWDLAGPGGMGVGIALDVGGTIVPVEIPSSHAGDFFGFTSDMAFTKIILSTGTQAGSAETYEFDNAVWSPAAVPEPTSMALFGLTAIGLAAVRRRRQNAVDQLV